MERYNEFKQTHILSMLVEITLRSLRVRFDSIGVGFGIPIGRTNLSVFLHKLESLDESQGFVNRSSHGQIVDRYLPNDTVGIDDEQTPQRDSGLLQQDTIIGGDFLGQVGQKGIIHLSQAALFAWGVNPG